MQPLVGGQVYPMVTFLTKNLVHFEVDISNEVFERLKGPLNDTSIGSIYQNAQWPDYAELDNAPVSMDNQGEQQAQAIRGELPIAPPPPPHTIETLATDFAQFKFDVTQTLSRWMERWISYFTTSSTIHLRLHLSLFSPSQAFSFPSLQAFLIMSQGEKKATMRL
ncbi:hypothetical protein Acr_00g0019080 [Actinidia rufa]|uniref:Uncharacterized protein n=1 Tax=Actinidia rufa TaxID=165716 RepID=A0A7J0DBX7_9ERIC|nr:hypothetical protein Acr_00g0019080 [Actinidia rufa]